MHNIILSCKKISGISNPLFSGLTVLALVAQLVIPIIGSAADTGLNSPSANIQNGNNDSWSNPTNAYSNGSGAASDNEGDRHRYYNFNLGIPVSSAINGIEVKVDTWSSDSSGCQLGIDLSWNGGNNWSSEKTQNLTGNEGSYTLGGGTDKWGSHNWQSTEFSDANFRARVRDVDPGSACTNSATTYLDWLQVKVYYTEPVQPAPNPELSQSCGLDIALVLDSSGSIDNNELNQMKDAFEAFVDAFLPETPTQFSVIDFDDTATVLQGFTSDASLINTAINAPTSGGYTNWEQGLLEAQGTFDPRPNPNLVIFASDGAPNRIGNPVQQVSGSEALEAAMVVANGLKNSGTRIIALGIGDALNVASLEKISSADAVYTSNFETLASDLADLASQLCGGTITARKIIDEDGDLQTPGDQTPGEGWNFDVAGSQEVTDQSGYTSAVKVDQGTYSVSETPETGYSLIDASCSGATNNGTLSGETISGIEAGNQDIVSCVFYNSPQCIPSEEVCDGVDNDCDGYIDEDISPEPTSCGVGACASTGELICSNGELVDTCQPGAPSDELCDGQSDENCDGTVDEGCECTDGDIRQCGETDEGECSFGTQTCVGGQWGTCEGAVGPTDEVCDGLDNDCDGYTDEDLTAPNADKQWGVCARSLKVCDGVNGWIEPDYTLIPYYENPEVSCDKCDNDCDGAVDEDGVCSYCGNGQCNGEETCSTCPEDCGECPPPEPYCGDEGCNGEETCSTCSEDCGECPPPVDILGCTDPVANNYNSDATADDGSCAYGSGSSSGGYAPGQVLGEEVVAECGLYLYEYIQYGADNNPEEVKKLQIFLNDYMGSNLPITGIYDLATMNVLNQFQVQCQEEVLRPWVDDAGTHCDVNQPTGYVYKTTQRWINLIMCPTLNLPMPDLSAYYPKADCAPYWQAVLGEEVTTTEEDGATDGTVEETGEGDEATPTEEITPLDLGIEEEAETEGRGMSTLWFIIIIILVAAALIWLVFKGMKK